MVNVECQTDFDSAPLLHVNFAYEGKPQKIVLKLPVMINKFFEAAEMDSTAFFARWRNLSAPGQECQKIFKANGTMETDQIRVKLSGFGIGVLDAVDPNPENFCGAGVIHSKQQQMGCLLRLEPNRQASMFRLTIRSNKEMLSAQLAAALEAQL